jgi:hypothetical protein
VNRVLIGVAERSASLLVQPHREAFCYLPDSWHVDRLHPSTAGHRRLAGLVAAVLREDGWPVAELEVPDPAGVAGRVTTAHWLVRHGTPWAARRARDLLPTLVALAARQALVEPWSRRAVSTQVGSR